jgi:hypothetical protein
MEHWSKLEVELVVSDYFRMLINELSGIPYIKSEHRKRLAPLLNNRSDGSIEFKYQNISAALIKLGQPYIKGYLPRYNYQALLEEVVIDWLYSNPYIEDNFRKFADKEIQNELIYDYGTLITPPPMTTDLAESEMLYSKKNMKVNYLEKEQSNTKLGELGEQFVLNYEKWALTQKGKENLAEQIKWISKEEGDGAGFDILSKNENGTDKYIEVKTTKLGKETPFFFSQNELNFSKKHSEKFHLFRLYDFERNVRMFTLGGSLNTICHSSPVLYKGYF